MRKWIAAVVVGTAMVVASPVAGVAFAHGGNSDCVTGREWSQTREGQRNRTVFRRLDGGGMIVYAHVAGRTLRMWDVCHSGLFAYVAFRDGRVTDKFRL